MQEGYETTYVLKKLSTIVNFINFVAQHKNGKSASKRIATAPTYHELIDDVHVVELFLGGRGQDLPNPDQIVMPQRPE